jgi:hypothetical protein
MHFPASAKVQGDRLDNGDQRRIEHIQETGTRPEEIP